MDRDDDHLKILSICFYVKGALDFMVGMFFCIYLALGGAIVSGALPMGPPPRGGGPGPEVMGWIFVVIGVVAISFAWVTASLNVFTGVSLGQRRRRTLCMITAGINCMNMPLGTLLGVFALIVLSRNTVQQKFA